jgi:hypothetical protein
MNYKNIPSMLHNFGHSFVSLENYVGGEYGRDLLLAALAELPEGRLTIAFPSLRFEPRREYSVKLRQSASIWATALHRHRRVHGISAQAVPEFEMVFSRGESGRLCRVRATDDRGKLHEIDVAEVS